MRNMLLEEMLAELRHEARISGDVAHGTHLTARHTALLRRVQEHLHMSYDWPELTVTRDVALAAGQRYVAYPDQIDHANIRKVYYKTPSGEWEPLLNGIRIEHLNHVDSDDGEQAERPARWQNYLSDVDTTIAGTMMEVWPVPNVATTLRFSGQRKLLPLTVVTDTSTLDGPLIVLYAAAEILAGQKADDAQLKLSLAAERLRVLRSRQNSQNSDTINPGRSNGPKVGQRFRVPS